MLIQEHLLYEDFYPINETLSIKHPTIKDVITFKESNYNALINIFLVYPIDLIAELYEMGFENYDEFFEYYDALTQYDIFMMFYHSKTDLFRDLIKFFLGDVDLLPAHNSVTNEYILYDQTKNIVFDITAFMVMSSFIKKVHHIKEDRSKTAKKSKSLKKVLIETGLANKDYFAKQREQEGISGKGDNRYNKLITKLCVSSKFSREELENKKLFEFYEIQNEVISYNYWSYRMQGFYSGNIDPSKVNKKELDWFNN
jgi:hypothetical protein